MKKITLDDLLEVEDYYSYDFKYYLMMTVIITVPMFFLPKRGTIRELILCILTFLIPFSFAIQKYIAYRALKKGNIQIRKCVVDFYSYPYVRIDGKLRRCEVPYNIEGDECYHIANANFSYFILPPNIEFDDFLQSKVVD